MDAKNIQNLMLGAISEVEKIDLKKEECSWVIGKNVLETTIELGKCDQEKNQIYGIDFLTDPNNGNRLDLYIKLCGANVGGYYIEEYMTDRGDVQYIKRCL